MKKFYALVLALACCSAVNAESLKILSFGLGTPSVDEPQMQGLRISPNGQYVCGAIEWGLGIFITDLKTDKSIYTLAGEDGGELRGIDNKGLAVGLFDGIGGVTYDYATENVDEVDSPEGYKFVNCEGITNDGSMMIGSMVGTGFLTQAAYKVGDGEWKTLPVPTKEELNGINTRLESAAKFISADGKVILGCLGSFTVPIVWIRNDQGEYEYDLFITRLLNLDENDPNALQSISGMYLALSNNGKYVVSCGLVKSAEVPGDGLLTVPVVYDTETKEFTIYRNLQNIDGSYRGLYTTAVSDDCTLIGTVGTPYFSACASFIWKAGEPEAEAFIDAFPAYDKALGEADLLGFGIPTGVTPDGRYILGYIYTTDDFNDASTPAYYVTYLIDRDGDSGIGQLTTDGALALPQAIYNLNGQRVSNMSQGGIYLVRMSDGSVQKVIKK